jgi:predicted aspartyl protease
MEIGFNKLPSLFGRLKGQNGAVREYLALVDAGSEYCILPKIDAFRLGYPDVAQIDTVVQAPNTTHFVTHLGFGKAPLIKIKEVALGRLTFGDVDFLAFDLPQACGFDVVFGRSLLHRVGLEVDFSKGMLRLGRGS